MTYTREEQNQLIKNACKIQKWIDENCDNLRENFEIRFGNMKEFGRMGEKVQPEFELTIIEGNSYHRMGKSTLAHHLDRYAEGMLYNYDYLFALCKNWKSIKEGLLIRIDNESQISTAISNFEV